MTSRRSSGSMQTASVVEPTRSANITVTWRRSAVSWVFGSVTATGIEDGASGAAVRAAIAFSSFLRWPSDATPMSLRSSFVSRPSSSPSMSLARKISAYWARPIPRSQPSMSKFSPHLGSCQRQFSKKVESLAPTMIPRGFLNQLGFAMWTPTTRQKHSRTVTRYQTDLTDTEWGVIAPHLRGCVQRAADLLHRRRPAWASPRNVLRRLLEKLTPYGQWVGCAAGIACLAAGRSDVVIVTAVMSRQRSANIPSRADRCPLTRRLHEGSRLTLRTSHTTINGSCVVAVGVVPTVLGAAPLRRARVQGWISAFGVPADPWPSLVESRCATAATRRVLRCGATTAR